MSPDATIAISGQVVLPGGEPLADRPVRLAVDPGGGDLGVAVLTLGIACAAGTCNTDVRDGTTDAGGSYRFDVRGRETQSMFGEARSVVVSASAAPDEGDVSGAVVAARFRVQTDEVTLPVLRLVDPGLAVADAGAVRATWQTARPGPYEVTFEEAGDTQPVWTERVAASEALVDPRLLEDTAGRVVVAAESTEAVEGSEVTVRWRSPGQAYASAVGPPPSRGRACSIEFASGPPTPPAPCDLTDGNLGSIASTAGCPPPPPEGGPAPPCTPTAVTIDLAAPVPAELVVVRGCAGGCAVDTSADGVTFRPAGAVSDGTGALGLPGAPVRAVRVGLGRSGLREVSVWGPRPAGPALREPRDDMVDQLGDPADRTGRAGTPSRAALVIAALALATVLVAVGFVAGRGRGAS